MRLRHSLLPALALCGLAAAAPRRRASPFTLRWAIRSPTATRPASLDAADGYQGYVAPFANFLGIPAAKVFNLAISGETTAVLPAARPLGLTANPQRRRLANTNYGKSAERAAVLP